MVITSKLTEQCLNGVDQKFNVNHFLFERNCFLKTHIINGMMSGNIINHECFAYNINQRFILMTLQREQGLISKIDISQVKPYKRADGRMMNPLDGACGVGLYDDRTLDKYLGFQNQIKGACATYRFWFDSFKENIELEMYDRGEDGKYIKVIPGSALVYALLRYTPHLGIIKKSEDIFEEFFTQFEGW